jgi:hypothetical protein
MLKMKAYEDRCKIKCKEDEEIKNKMYKIKII